MLFTPAPKGHSNFQQHNQQISEIQFLVELSSRGNGQQAREKSSKAERVILDICPKAFSYFGPFLSLVWLFGLYNYDVSESS